MSIYAQMWLASLTVAVRGMFFHPPFAFAHHLDAGAVDQEMQTTLLLLYRDVHL